ncbi:MAG TPA: (4Fe-4S)-binding protein [Ferruginibacter sp.]|nr:(4Fe-4S)-binding protein [Ferruginibacter sp.]
MPLSTHKYPNGEVTVIWQPDICIHSGVCARGLIEVFDPRRTPWIDMSLLDTETIKAQIKKCPSGALSYIEP